MAGVDFVQLGGGVGGGGGGDGFERAECGAGLVAVQPVVQGAACWLVRAGVGCVGIGEDAEENQKDDGDGVFHGVVRGGCAGVRGCFVIVGCGAWWRLGVACHPE